MSKYTIIYVFIPSTEVLKYEQNEPISYCKIGMTSSDSNADEEVIKAINKRGRSTGYPYKMTCVDYLCFNYMKHKVDDYFRNILYELSQKYNEDITLSMFDRNNNNMKIISLGKEFVYNTTKKYIDLTKLLISYIIEDKDDLVTDNYINSLSASVRENLLLFKTDKQTKNIKHQHSYSCFNTLIHSNNFNDICKKYIKESLLTLDDLYNERKDILLSNKCGSDNISTKLKNISYLMSSVYLTESFQSIRFRSIYNFASTHKLNISAPNNYKILYNAIKYQILVIAKDIKSYKKQDIYYIILLYIIKFFNSIDCYNPYKDENDTIIYNPLYSSTICKLISEIYDSIFIEHNYDVYTINGSKWTLDINYIKRTSPLTVKRFSETQLKEIISKAEEELNHKPSVNELVGYINDSINPADYDYDMDAVGNMMVNYRKVKHYIDMYDLSDMISKVVRRSKEQIAEDKIKQQ